MVDVSKVLTAWMDGQANDEDLATSLLLSNMQAAIEVTEVQRDQLIMLLGRMVNSDYDNGWSDCLRNTVEYLDSWVEVMRHNVERISEQ